MSMIGEFCRLSPEELERTRRDPAWANEHVLDDLVDTDRATDVDKSWHAIAFLLSRAEFPVNLIHGEMELPGAGDWGYGPPRYLTPPQVTTASDALRGLTEERLFYPGWPADADGEGLYPQIWDDDTAPEYVRGHFRSLVAFVHAAARDGDALLVWLD